VKRSDDENLELVEDDEGVDRRNSEFYSRFPFPWPPMTFPTLEDPQFETVMLNQSIGDWKHSLIPEKPRIWVAGCGTNQGIYTALQFPRASITASDISPSSIEISSQRALDFSLSNIRFRQESLNKIDYQGEFDYILCTGVVHHNANPQAALSRVARALKPNGILELMVYNRYHRTFTTAIQKVVRLFHQSDISESRLDEELKTARKIIATGPVAAEIRTQLLKWPEAKLADHLMQPVEHSYTVESLAHLADECGLELRLSCFNQFDKSNNRFSWNIRFEDVKFQQRYAGLPDRVRWQISNLLLLENSPMLWFYLQRRSGSRDLQFEWQVCEEFLDQKFTRTGTRLRNYVRAPNHDYQLATASVPFPWPPENQHIRAIVEASQSGARMREILTELGIDTSDYKVVNEIRIQTTTPLCPYLRAVQ